MPGCGSGNSLPKQFWAAPLEPSRLRAAWGGGDRILPGAPAIQKATFGWLFHLLRPNEQTALLVGRIRKLSAMPKAAAAGCGSGNSLPKEFWTAPLEPSGLRAA